MDASERAGGVNGQLWLRSEGACLAMHSTATSLVALRSVGRQLARSVRPFVRLSVVEEVDRGTHMGKGRIEVA